LISISSSEYSDEEKEINEAETEINTILNLNSDEEEEINESETESNTILNLNDKAVVVAVHDNNCR
jgi:hypothetical protein